MVRPVDIEGGLVAYLDGLLEVPVSTRVPAEERPESFVRLYKVGGVRTNLAMERPLVFVEAWAGSELAAFDLAAEVWSALDAADGAFVAPGVWLADAANLSTPVRNDDPESGQCRYTFTANLTVTFDQEAS